MQNYEGRVMGKLASFLWKGKEILDYISKSYWAVGRTKRYYYLK